MKPGVMLRVASVLAFIQCVTHGFFLLTYVPKHGPREVEVVAAMKASLFNFGGLAPHSYWELYIGYGLFAAFNCLVEAVLFWQLATISRAFPNALGTIKPIIVLFLLANLGYAILILKYFFMAPLVFDLAIALCLSLAAFSLKRQEPAEPAARSQQLSMSV